MNKTRDVRVIWGRGVSNTPTHPISTSPIIKHNLHPSKLHLHTFSQHALQNDCTSTVLKIICTGVVLPKINILSSFNQPNVIPDYYSITLIAWTKTVETFFKISSFLFLKRKKVIQVWNYIHKYFFYFWVHCYFKTGPSLVGWKEVTIIGAHSDLTGWGQPKKEDQDSWQATAESRHESLIITPVFKPCQFKNSIEFKTFKHKT